MGKNGNAGPGSNISLCIMSPSLLGRRITIVSWDNNRTYNPFWHHKDWGLEKYTKLTTIFV